MLEYRDRCFNLHLNGRIERIPVNKNTSDPDKVVYRKDDNFAVWDSRGLTIRKGKRIHSTRMWDVALTPKLFSREQILETRDLIKHHERWKDANALSGSMRVGDSVYFLVRWDGSNAKPWLEALIRVDLGDESLHPELLGRFQGLTCARKKVDDGLMDDGNKIYAITQTRSSGWGVATFDPKSGSFDFKPIGKKLAYVWPLSPKAVLVEQETDYGSKCVSRLDISNQSLRTLMEFRGVASLISDTAPLVLKIEGDTGSRLLNLNTGALLEVSPSVEARQEGKDVVVWEPGQPENANLYDAERWQLLAAVGLSTRVPENSRVSGRLPSRSHNRRGRPVLPASRPSP